MSPPKALAPASDNRTANSFRGPGASGPRRSRRWKSSPSLWREPSIEREVFAHAMFPGEREAHAVLLQLDPARALGAGAAAPDVQRAAHRPTEALVVEVIEDEAGAAAGLVVVLPDSVG